MKESLIVSAIANYLQYLENQGKCVFQRNNSGALPTAKGGFIRFGKTGAPDFIIWLPQGNCICIEVKNEKGKLSPGQKEFKDKIEKLSYKYYLVRSLSDVENILK